MRCAVFLIAFGVTAFFGDESHAQTARFERQALDGYCGAGSESYVAWIRLRGRRIVGRDADSFDSCLENRIGRVTGWHGTLFTVETELEGRRTRITYDATRPSAGLRTDPPDR